MERKTRLLLFGALIIAIPEVPDVPFPVPRVFTVNPDRTSVTAP
jgi:hypothetical protein